MNSNDQPGQDSNPQNIPTTQESAEKIQKQAQRMSKPPQRTGGGTLATEPILVVNQKAKLIELQNEYAIYDQQGQQIGAVRQVGQSKLRKVMRFISSIDQFLKHQLEIVDAQGNVILEVVRPSKFIKSRFEVSDSNGLIGEIIQKNVFGKISFSFKVADQEVGSLNAENWRAWNFNIQDTNGQELARITKTFGGLLKSVFTTGDNYVVEIPNQLEGPLQAMVLASALTVDTALKQDSGGGLPIDF